MQSKLFNNKIDSKKYIDLLFENYDHVKIEPYKKTRTNQQNRALHLYFSFMADALNEFTSFQYQGLKDTYEIPYNVTIVKEFVWRPVQKAITGKESTTKLTTSDINEILRTFDKFFSEKGIELTFPSWENWIKANEI
jgi:hypothetical protein